MQPSVRRRAVLAVLIGVPVGWLYVDIGWHLAIALLASMRGTDPGSVACRSSTGLSSLVGQFNGCNSFNYRSSYAAVELVLGTVVLVAIAYGLGRWVVQPVRQMGEAVAQLGPTNLGLRLRPGGASRDETRVLGEAINHMLDGIEQSYNAQRRFASNASHELRTPLATQRALIEISLSQDLTPDQLALVARQLLATNERNERTIDGLLTLAETDQGLLATQPVALDSLLARVVAALQPAADDRQLGLVLDAAPATVLGEAALLERLFSNLVQNAVKYNDPGGRITVTVHPGGQVVVANTGPSVPGDQVAGLFEPFRRLGGDRLDHGGGAGLGLTIARSIVAAHRGTIAATANPDGGLTVVVTLPLVTGPRRDRPGCRPRADRSRPAPTVSRAPGPGGRGVRPAVRPAAARRPAPAGRRCPPAEPGPMRRCRPGPAVHRRPGCQGWSVPWPVRV